ncbi:hypothetical protein mRhiFer1_009110 [Rhinolophus ferrumequinum]|uniref:Uncharacterized protein n=1 Tax=Rhinolophus ferrumequinum TaxID=59479 RepID=A0A7J7SJC9_RHIFE|nr:hypothetical protein mRhiFer1_009110 [Rhinolophus ferrumequinum]
MEYAPPAAETRYRVSWKKAQLCRKQVQYLGFVISKGQWALSTEQKKIITSLPQPTSQIALQDQEHTFQQLKSSLGQAPALGLPDAERPFHLFIHERDKVALGLLAQTVGPRLRPIAYLSKKLDPVAADWPPCLQALAATEILIKEADKLTLGQRLIVKVPHSVTTLMNSQGPRWLSNAWLTQYQGLLLENPRISLETVHALNPATFLPSEEGDPEHDCIEVINEIYATRPDLRDSPHPNPDLTLYTDGSSFLRDGKRHMGYTVTTTDEGGKVNIYTDSRYDFATVHIHGAIYKERVLLTVEGKTIKDKQEILELLQTIWLPQQVAVIHCQGHRRGNEPSAIGNQLADTMAKSAAMGSPTELLLVTDTTTTSFLWYTKEELRWAKSEGANRLPQGWWQLPDKRLFIPALLGPEVTAENHKLTHLGKTALEGLLAKNFYISRLSALCRSIGERCLTCAKNNPKSGPSPTPGIQRSGTAPFEDLKVDFTDMTNCHGTKYLLVLVCTYSGWVEAFPTRTEKSHEVAKVLLREIISRYGIPLSIHSDNGPAFIAELLQTVTRATGINWRLHRA